MIEQIYTTEEVAEILQVSATHVRNSIHRGDIKAYKEGRKGGFRIFEKEVEKYLDKKLKTYEERVTND